MQCVCDFALTLWVTDAMMISVSPDFYDILKPRVYIFYPTAKRPDERKRCLLRVEMIYEYRDTLSDTYENSLSPSLFLYPPLSFGSVRGKKKNSISYRSQTGCIIMLLLILPAASSNCGLPLGYIYR